MIEEETLYLVDANGREREGQPRPWLVFDTRDGRVIIADDNETVNDVTARDFVLSKDEAIELAAALLTYAMYGTPSTVESVSGIDIENGIMVSAARVMIP